MKCKMVELPGRYILEEISFGEIIEAVTAHIDRVGVALPRQFEEPTTIYLTGGDAIKLMEMCCGMDVRIPYRGHIFKLDIKESGNKELGRNEVFIF